MFYEGSEKRLEITSTVNLFSFDNNFWQQMVKQAGAEIISTIKNESLKAFLLSESSLFIWKNRLLLITCGETHLVQAALFFQKRVSRSEIKSLLFQRHQAFQPERQQSSFQQDSLQLQKKLKGGSQHWSENYHGDIFLFGDNSHPFATKNILMLHDLEGIFFSALQKGKIAQEKVALQLKLSDYFSDFTIDQYSFEPKGYSLNAICAERYFTLHITPEKHSSYLSVESNIETRLLSEFQQHLITLFNPKRSYLMTFKQSENVLAIKTQVLTNT